MHPFIKIERSRATSTDLVRWNRMMFAATLLCIGTILWPPFDWHALERSARFLAIGYFILHAYRIFWLWRAAGTQSNWAYRMLARWRFYRQPWCLTYGDVAIFWGTTFLIACWFE